MGSVGLVEAADINLKGFKVAILATDGFEESELLEPVKALKKAEAQVDVISVKSGSIQGYKHHDKTQKVNVDKTFVQAKPEDYDAIVLPGGALNADALRVVPEAKAWVQTFNQMEKPIASICHAPWLLVSAGLVKGRTLTSYHTIQDDIRNAGGHWLDQEVVKDRNWVTSRKPDDLPAFNKAAIELFARTRQPVGARL
jgi:protease I